RRAVAPSFALIQRCPVTETGVTRARCTGPSYLLNRSALYWNTSRRSDSAIGCDHEAASQEMDSDLRCRVPARWRDRIRLLVHAVARSTATCLDHPRSAQ